MLDPTRVILRAFSDRRGCAAQRAASRSLYVISTASLLAITGQILMVAASPRDLSLAIGRGSEGREAGDSNDTATDS